MKTFAAKAISYFNNITVPKNLPDGIKVMNPYLESVVKDIVKDFFTKYYNDGRKVVFIFGINPGRFGGGLTGISFTDPVALKDECGIDNCLSNRKEISSEFVYKVINEFGGTERFFSNFYLTALYPLAIIKDGKNCNYYDSKELINTFKPEIYSSVKNQVSFGGRKDVVISFGKKNGEFLKQVNDEMKLFDRIEILEHPRFIMQYRRKSLTEYISRYIELMNSLLLNQ